MGVLLRVRSSWDESSPEVSYSFGHDRVSIGRGAGVDVQLPHPAVSALHATLRQSGAGYTIVDEGSTNGSLVNGGTLVALRPKPLRSGDTLELGGFVLEVEIGPVGESTSAGETAMLARQLVRAIALEGELPAASAAFLIANGPARGERFPLPPAPARLVIGRGESCDLRVDDADASREHVEVVLDHQGARLEDLGSKNGALVNGVRVETTRLHDRDEVQLGATVLIYDDPAVAAVAAIAGGDDLVTEIPRAKPRLSEPPAAPESGGATLVDPEPAADAQDDDAPEPAPPSVPSADEGVTSIPLREERPGTSAGDALLYGLALLVLVASVGGLLWLLG